MHRLKTDPPTSFSLRPKAPKGDEAPTRSPANAPADRHTRPNPAWNALARAVSLILSLTIFGVLSVAPFVVGTAMNGRIHGAISLILLGASIAVVHGFGLRPDGRFGRWLVSPLVAWPLIAAGAAILVLPA